MRLRGYTVVHKKDHPNLILNHVLYINLNKTWKITNLVTNNSLLYLNNHIFFDSDFYDKPSYNKFESCHSIDENYQEKANQININSKQKNKAHIMSVSSNNKPIRKDKQKHYFKKYVQKLENFNFNLIQNYRKGVEVLLFRPISKSDSVNSKNKMYVMELMIINFTDHKSFNGK